MGMNIKVKTALRAILIGSTVLPLVILAIVSAVQIFGFSKTVISDEAATAGAAQSAAIANIADAYMSDAAGYAGMDLFVSSVKDMNGAKADLDTISNAAKAGGSVLDIVVSGSDGGVLYSSAGVAVGTHFFGIDDRKVFYALLLEALSHDPCKRAYACLCKVCRLEVSPGLSCRSHRGYDVHAQLLCPA